MVDSIFVQKFDDWELLLINDGSSDSCAKIIDDYAGEDSRIRAFHKENGGTYSGFNLGIEQAIGKYIVFACADDTFMLNAFEVIARQADEYDYDIIFIPVITSTCDENQNILRYNVYNKSVSEPVKIIGKTNVENNWFSFLGLANNPINVYKSSIIKKYRFREDYYGADVLMNTAIADEITSAACSNENLYNHFVYSDVNSEHHNISQNKYYDYMHEMYNEFYITSTNLFSKWNLLDQEILICLANFRMVYLTKNELYQINAFNNNHTPSENIDIITSYYDDIILEAAVATQSLPNVDESLFCAIDTLFQNNQISDDFDNPVVQIIRLLNGNNNFEQIKSQIANGLLDYRNPYRIGFESYKTLCTKHPKIANTELLEYLETERTARKLLFNGKFESALDAVMLLFGSIFSTPEQYVILALCGYHLGLIEDSKNAVETGLDIFPNYMRLEELRDIINIERNN